ncbi:HNH endonuclease [Bacillus phage vB_BanS_Sophrita]|uniref:GCC-box binding domain protein n=1 Tax=Bacillus phage vB_BanS_Sophrita TaxID=2894790 RepID=A0AAE8YU27_9CAUD|nr:HNH endonuclease [Bacillus phage vB_BanS_Sophrita]UGO50602.1 GCC-box binding domain protein [Bacillus phage vB_BanS_Sophrita]
MVRKFNDRTGESNTNNYGSKMTIIKYDGANDIIVEFENGYRKQTSYNSFKEGVVKTPYDKTVHGTGYVGEGNYQIYDKDNKSKKTKSYEVWSSMIRRCYSEEFQRKHPSYVDCTVCLEWHNYQIFSDWFQSNYYEIEGEQMNLDKDILIKGNKIYNPESSIFVPKKINSLFPKVDARRGSTPIGVQFIYNTYRAYSSNQYLGTYSTSEEAFIAYKRYKENVIKDVANEYMGKIPLKLYYALMTYEVEITD